MKTNDLIDQLARDLPPTQPLARPLWRAATWWLGGIVYVVAISAAMHGGQLPAPWTGGTGVWLPLLAAVGASLVATIAAFAAVVPGRAPSTTGALLIATLLWLGALVATSTWQTPLAAVVNARHEWICVGLIVVGGAPLMAVLTSMLRRGAPLHPATTTALAALAVGTLANVSACWSLPHASNEITLVWHGAAVLALVLLGALVGSRVLRWRRAVIGSRG
jgi:hypothetical protein